MLGELFFIFIFLKERYATKLICPILSTGMATVWSRRCHGDWAVSSASQLPHTFPWYPAPSHYLFFSFLFCHTRGWLCIYPLPPPPFRMQPMRNNSRENKNSPHHKRRPPLFLLTNDGEGTFIPFHSWRYIRDCHSSSAVPSHLSFFIPKNTIIIVFFSSFSSHFDTNVPWSAGTSSLVFVRIKPWPLN